MENSKLYALVGAETELTSVGSQTTPFHGGNIRPRKEICETSGLPTAVVPRVYRSNGFIKRNLREWRAQKCNALVGAETALVRGRKLPRSMRGEYRAEKGKMRNFGRTNSHGNGFARNQ